MFAKYALPLFLKKLLQNKAIAIKMQKKALSLQFNATIS